MSTGTPTAIPASAGIGLRAAHYQALLERTASVPWVEVHAENYFSAGGIAHDWLGKIRRNYALSLHGVGLSIGSAESLNRGHLAKLKQLVDRYQPVFVSEHLSWSSIDGRYHNDLLPLPCTREAVDLVCNRLDEVQAALGRQVLIENVSSYVTLGQSELDEAEFLTAIAKRSGCGILLDVNNVFVNAWNHDFDALDFIRSVPADLVAELHLAGHTSRVIHDSEYLIDTHDGPVCDQVWDLYAKTLMHTGCKPTLIEWDSNLPDLPDLLSQAECAAVILERHARQAA